jgi:PKD repeat protein
MGNGRMAGRFLYALGLALALALLPAGAGAREPAASMPRVVTRPVPGADARTAAPETAGRWAKLIAAPGVKSASVVKETSDGGMVFDGETNSWGAGQRDFWIFKLDSAGSQAWAYTIGDASDNGGASQATDDGGYIVAGWTSSGGGTTAPWIMKLDSNAAITWQRTYNLAVPFGATALGVAKILTDGYILSGLHMDLSSASFVFDLVRTDLSGNILWQKSYGATNKMINGGSVVRLSDGSLVVGGMITDMGTQDSDLYLMKLTSGGDVVWAKTYGGPQQEVGGTGVLLTGDGGFFIFGQTKSWGMGGTANGVGDLWALKLDSSGAIQWQKAYGGAGDDTGTILPDAAGGYLIGATTTSWGAGGQDIWFAKLDSSGNITLQKTYGGTGDDYGAVLPNPTGSGYIISATTESFGHGLKDEWAAKLDASGNVLWQYVYGTSIDEEGAAFWTLPSGDFLAEGFTRNPTPPSVTNQDFWAIRADSNGSLGAACPFIQTGTAVTGTASGVATVTTATPVALAVTVSAPGYTAGASSLTRTAITMSPADLCTGSPGPLTASASADHTSGTAPLAVQFTGSASGGTAPYTYDWNFGDGSAHSSAQSPSHSYSSAGNFPVTLTVHDAASGTATDTHLTIAVSAAGALTATAAASATSGETPLTVNFTGSASGGTAPYSFSWNFGDGGTTTAQNPAHTYATPGDYTVTLTVQDSASHSASDSHLVIHASAPLTGNLLTWSAPAPGGLNPPQNLQVSATQGAARETVLNETEPNGCITLIGGSDTPQILHPGDTVNGTVQDTDAEGCLEDSGTGDPIEDLYGLTISQAGTYTITLSFDAGSDLDLYLVTTDLQTLNPVCGVTTCGLGCDNPETFEVTLDPGTYVVGVSIATVVPCESASSASYSLSVTGGASAPVLQGYNVYRATMDSDPSYTQINGALLPASPTSYTDTTPPGGTVYYRVKAVYDQGESGFSNTATAGGGSLPSGAPWAWGYNSSGQVGDGTTTDRLSPVTVSGLSGVAAFAGGEAFSLALKSDGTVAAWGYNFAGQLGNGTWTTSSVPVAVSGLTGVTKIAAGRNHSLAIKNDGSLWAWGYNSKGQLGNGGSNSNVPVVVAGLTGVTAVEAGDEHSIALKSDGTVWTWGGNTNGQLGNGTSGSGSNPTPQQVASLSNVRAVSAGYSYCLALKYDGTVWAWGYNYNGQLGDGTTTQRTTPVQVNGLTNVVAIAAGYAGSLALKDNGTVWAWGWNGASTESHVPVLMEPYPNAEAAEVAAGYLFAMIRLTDGTVWTWGRNTHGQLGDGTTTWRNTPVQVTGLGYATSISAGDYHALATVGSPPCSLACEASRSPGTFNVGVPVSFFASPTTTHCQGSPTFEWTFGDGGTSSEQNPTHAYAAAGVYPWWVNISIEGLSCGNGGTVTITDVPPPLQSSSSADKTSGVFPLTVAFTGSASGGVPPYAYDWNFGDGTAHSSSQNPTHTYGQAGAFTAVLTVTDSASSTAQAAGITIAVIAPLSASASVNAASGNVPLAVAFSGSASGGTGPYTYDWNFGDGTAHSSAQSPTHTYVSAGDFSVTLTVTDSASRTATDSHLVIHAVAVPPPVVTSMTKLVPFGIKVTGSNLQNGIRVFINGTEWTNVQWKSTSKVKILGGASLKAVVPKGTTRTFRFLNPGGGEATMTWGY